MRSNPRLEEQPHGGHYPACSTRMLEIKKETKRLFFFALFSSIFMIFLIFIGSSTDLSTQLNFFYSGAYSFLPLMLCSPDKVMFIFLHLFELILLMLLGFLGLTKFKICHVIIFAYYLISLLGTLFVPECQFISIGTTVCVLGILFSFRSINVFLDDSQLRKTEGYPYFSELFDSFEGGEYQSVYQKQFDALPKNPVRRFGDNAPIPLKPDQIMNDIADAPMAESLLKPENHKNDSDYKFEEV